MNEPKRRGRPPNKAKVEGASITPEMARELTQEAVAADKAANADHPVYEVVGRRTDMHDIAQAYALRVWNGQSPDVKREEKIRRVKLALEGQNLPFEGVELP
jgi:hypothetical protein